MSKAYFAAASLGLVLIVQALARFEIVPISLLAASVPPWVFFVVPFFLFGLRFVFVGVSPLATVLKEGTPVKAGSPAAPGKGRARLLGVFHFDVEAGRFKGFLVAFFELLGDGMLWFGAVFSALVLCLLFGLPTEGDPFYLALLNLTFGVALIMLSLRDRLVRASISLFNAALQSGSQ